MHGGYSEDSPTSSLYDFTWGGVRKKQKILPLITSIVFKNNIIHASSVYGIN